MRKLLKWAIITFGIAALARWWRGRSSGGDALEPPVAPASAADPADELRRKLAESREEGPEGEADEASVDERRAEVHAEGRAAIDEMQSPRDDA